MLHMRSPWQPHGSAAFFGAARDCAAHLPHVLQNLDRFAAAYDEASFHFVVSDCTDDSACKRRRAVAPRKPHCDRPSAGPVLLV